MKFGKTLLRAQVPEWARHYIAYKTLKQVVTSAESIERELSSGTVAEDVRSHLTAELDDIVTGNLFFSYETQSFILF